MKRAHTEIPPKTLFGEPLTAYIAPTKPLLRRGLYADRESKKSDTPRIVEADDDENARDAFPGRREAATDDEDEDEGIGSMPIPVLIRSDSIDLAVWAAAQDRPRSPPPFPYRPLPSHDLHLDSIPEHI